jgi:AcrR family transcriptional regulator
MTYAERANDDLGSYRAKLQRGRPPRVSRQTILEAGLTLIKQNGIENLTMRTLAQALDVAPMSLYSHVKDKDDLLVGVAQIVFERIRFNLNENASWEQQLMSWMKDLHSQLQEFPQLPQLYTYNERYSASLLNTTAFAIEILKKSGLQNNEELVITARALMWFVLGYSTLESFVKPRTMQANTDLLFEQISTLAEQQQAILEPLKPLLLERDVNQIFEFSAELIIAGIKHRESIEKNSFSLSAIKHDNA